MKYVKKAGFSALSLINTGWLKKKARLPFLIPYQHVVSDEPLPHISNLYAFKNIRQFENDLDFLLRYFKPAGLKEVLQQVENGLPERTKTFLLTFDDGLRQVYDIIAPILIRKGIPAVFFINPAFVDNLELFYDLKKGLVIEKLNQLKGKKNILPGIASLMEGDPKTLDELISSVRSIHYLNRHIIDEAGKLMEIDFNSWKDQYRPFMTSHQIQHLVDRGFDVGAHSMDHPLYSLIPLQDQLAQTIQSMDWVCGKFGLNYRAFAFPHTDKGVSNEFFIRLFDQGLSSPHIVFGNTTAMMERHPRVFHRYIGENPSVSAAKMSNAVLGYNLLQYYTGRNFVRRP